MQNKSLLSTVLYCFNWLMIKITRPKTAVRGLDNFLNKNFFNLKRVPKWKALKIIDRLIHNSINTYHQETYKGENLYTISSIWTLRTALNVIKYNIAKKGDFIGTGEPATIIKHFKREMMYPWDQRIYNQFFNDDELQDVARKNSNTKDEFYDLMFDFSSYLYDLEKYKICNRRITNTITESRIDEYLSKNLYQISDETILEEAFDAIEIMRELLDKGVVLYDKRALQNLTLFLLKKARIEYNKGDFSNIEFDEFARDIFLKSENELLKKDKRNEQARARRAKEKLAAKKVQL